MPYKKKDQSHHIGQKFGFLTVMAIVYGGKNPKAKVSCNCGATKEIFLNALTSGGTRSCGCKSADLLRQTRSQKPRTARLCPKCGSGNRTKDNRCQPCRTIKFKNTEYKRKGILHNGEILRYEAYLRQLERQGGKCAVCSAHLQTGNGRLGANADHDHETKEFRGILCSACNTSLHSDFTIERLQRAIEYLTNPPALQNL